MSLCKLVIIKQTKIELTNLSPLTEGKLNNYQQSVSSIDAHRLKIQGAWHLLFPS
jgi:hypothetical protein